MNSKKELTIQNIYPNPINDKMYIELFSGVESKSELIIYSISGKKIFSDNIDAFIGTMTKNIDLSFLENGSYFLELKSMNGKMITKFNKL